MCMYISNSSPTFLEFVPQICVFANGNTLQGFIFISLLPFEKCRLSCESVLQIWFYVEGWDEQKNPASQRRAAFSRVSGETLWSVIE